MFCAKCGKKIDDDSTFCPYCGQKVHAKTGAKKRSGGLSEKEPLPESIKVIKKNKTLIGAVAVLIIAAAVIWGGVRLLGGGKFKSPLEKIFAMSWEESSDMTISDMREMLDDEGIIYEVEKSNYSGEVITTRVLDEFMGNDAFLRFIERDDNGRNILNYDVVYETSDDLKEARKELEDYLNKKLIKNTQVCSFVTGDDSIGSIYVIEKSDKNKDIFLNPDTSAAEIPPSDVSASTESTAESTDTAGSGDSYQETSDSEPALDLDNCSVYKIVLVWYENVDTSDVPGGKSYIDYVCNINVSYRLMSQEYYISYMARYGYDAIKGKEIDVAKFQASLDKSFIAILDVDGKTRNYSSDERKEYENRVYSKLYMMEEYRYDTEHGLYFETDDEKRLWYIQNYKWDTETKSAVDLSAYKNSAEIYCAVECDYNINEAKSFENDLEKALYLADKDYNMQTGKGFESTEEKRLYFMRNYSYDTDTGETVDREVVDALIAYQQYISERFPGYSINLMYIDEDNIPEVYLRCSGPDEEYLLTYRNSRVYENDMGANISLYYAEKKNLIYISGGRYGSYYDDFYSLSDGELHEMAAGYFDELLDGDYEWYSWNGNECSGKEDYYNHMNEFCNSQIGDAGWVNTYKTRSDSILAAYDVLNTITYTAYISEITSFELSGGILTLVTDGGIRYGSGRAKSFISYPVAEDCAWEFGPYASEGFAAEETTDYESFKKYLDEELAYYPERYETGNFGDKSLWCIDIEVTDGIIVRVYGTFS